MKVWTPIRPIAFAMLFSILLPAQNTATTPDSAPGNRTVTNPVAQQTAQSQDDLSQIRDDLNKMESLNMNMSSEIEFLRDQNLQILLRTNSQMWTILIRDLRRRLAQEEQLRTSPPPPGVKK